MATCMDRAGTITRSRSWRMPFAGNTYAVSLAILAMLVSQWAFATDYSKRTRIENRKMIQFIKNPLMRSHQPADAELTNLRMFQLDDAIGISKQSGANTSGALVYLRDKHTVVVRLHWRCDGTAAAQQQACLRGLAFLKKLQWDCKTTSGPRHRCLTNTPSKKRISRTRPH